MLLQIPAVLNGEEIGALRQKLGDAAFQDGAATAGALAREVKRNLQLPAEAAVARQCAQIVLDALRRNSMFFSAALPQWIHGPIFNRYDVGMTYGEHVDNAVMGVPTVRTDVAATLFLAAPEEYDGGELAVNDSYGLHQIKLPAGSMIVYPAASVHKVRPVTRGKRLAAILWVQSLVRDERHRRLLFELDLMVSSLRSKGSLDSEVEAASSIYHNLLRLWAET